MFLDHSSSLLYGTSATTPPSPVARLIAFFGAFATFSRPPTTHLVAFALRLSSSELSSSFSSSASSSDSPESPASSSLSDVAMIIAEYKLNRSKV